MATRLPGQRAPGEEDVDGWCTREATMLLERTPHPNIPRVFQVGRWPHPESGFLYTVMEYVDGWRFHDWRYEKHPTAAQLVEVLLPLSGYVGVPLIREAMLTAKEVFAEVKKG